MSPERSILDPAPTTARMFDTATIASSHPPRRLRADTEVDVAFLRDPGDRMAPSADLVRSPAFFRLHAPTFARAWYAVVMDGGSGESLAGGWFAETSPGVAHSGVAAAFGGVHSPYAPLPSPLAARIVCACEEELRAREIHTVRVTLPPAAYEPDAHADWMNVYLRLGYVASPPDLSFHAPVGTAPFAEGMAPVPRAVVQTADRRGLRVRTLTPNERADAFTIVVADRTRGASAITWPLERLLALERAGDGLVHWHGVFQGERMIAASITLSLSPECAHVHALGEMPGASRHSPSALLVSQLHAWGARAEVRLLDLGLASARGEPLDERMALLRSLGLRATPQYTLEKALQG
jgi:hypothetical protein